MTTEKNPIEIIKEKLESNALQLADVNKTIAAWSQSREKLLDEQYRLLRELKVEKKRAMKFHDREIIGYVHDEPVYDRKKAE